MTNYRTRFLFAFAGNLLLIGAIAVLWWHYRTPKQPMVAEPQGVAAAQGSTQGAAAPHAGESGRRTRTHTNLPAAVAEHRREDR